MSEQMDISLCFAFIVWPAWVLGWHCLSSGVGQSGGVQTGTGARMSYTATRDIPPCTQEPLRLLKLNDSSRQPQFWENAGSCRLCYPCAVLFPC